jgi:hypothetical protein
MDRTFRVGKLFAAMVLGVTLLAVACSREASQTQPARTDSTESGASVSPPGADLERRDRALVRVIDAIPGNRPVDVLAGDMVVFPSIDYKTVTQYQELPDDRLNFRVRPAGQTGGESLAENSEGLAGGNRYTLVAYPQRDGTTELAAFSDNLTPPSEGKAKVRVIHAAPQVGEVDVYVVGRDTLFSGVNVGTGSTYNEVDPMEVTLQIRPEGRQNSLLNIDDVRFEPGKVYTIIVVGSERGQSRLEAIRVEDELVGTGTPTARAR